VIYKPDECGERCGAEGEESAYSGHIRLEFLLSEVLQSLESDGSELEGRRLGIGILLSWLDVTIVDDGLDLEMGVGWCDGEE
jgi:hypothetical protein